MSYDLCVKEDHFWIHKKKKNKQTYLSLLQKTLYNLKQ